MSNGVRVKHDDIMGAGAKINSDNSVGGNIAKVNNANCYDDITFQSMDSMAAVVNAVKNQVCNKQL